MNIDKRYHILLDSLYFRSKKEKGFTRALKLHQSLEEPAFNYPVIHIGGTNGKGSTATKIAHALTHSGKKVGLFTSPHITSFRERIQINGEMISKQEVLSIYEIIENIFNGLNPTFFEITTLMAFCYFAKQGVDYAVVEVGMGGRYDATNIVQPLLTVITTVAFDHMAYLGNTLKEISLQKGGIIKKGVPLILGPTAASQDALIKLAQKKQAPLYSIKKIFSNYEEENRAIAKEALKVLKIDQPSIEYGILQTPPCRFEVIQKKIPVVLDVAHNPEGILALLKRLKNTYPNQVCRFLIGLSENKELDEILMCFPKRPIHLMEAPYRAAKATKLAQILKKLGHTEVMIEQDPKKVCEEAREKGEILVITGTFYMMDLCKKILHVQTT